MCIEFSLSVFCFLFPLQFDKMLVNKCAGQRVEHTKNEGHIISKMIFIVKFKNRVSKCKMLVRLTALTKQTCDLQVHGREMISFSSFNSYTLFFCILFFCLFVYLVHCMFMSFRNSKENDILVIVVVVLFCARDV